MKNKKTSILLVLITLLIVNSIGLSSATVYILTYSAVDNGEIRYGGSTQYTTGQDYSFDTWNDLGEVNIAPDTIWTFEDLTYMDYDDEDDLRYGYYKVFLDADRVAFNEFYCDPLSSTEMKFVATHELGHALGLAHSCYPNIMKSSLGNYCTLGDDDIESYEYLYS